MKKKKKEIAVCEQGLEVFLIRMLQSIQELQNRKWSGGTRMANVQKYKSSE